MHNSVMLKETRKLKGLTQEQLAEISGVDQTVISRYEKGQIARPKWDNVLALSKALDVPPEQLFPVRVNQ